MGRQMAGLTTAGRVALGLVPRQRLGAHRAYLASDLTEVRPERAISMGVPVPSSASWVSAECLS